MSKKINTKTLSIAVVILLTIVLLTQLMDGNKNQRTFKDKLFDVDTSQITSLLIYPKQSAFEEIKFLRSGNVWNIVKDGKNFPVGALEIQNLLRQIDNLEVKRLAGRNSDNLEKFELSDSLATRVVIIAGKKTIGVLHVGKFGYNYETQDSFSYARVDDEEEIWAVNGFLQSIFDQQMNVFRYKAMINTIKSDWNKLQFSYPADSSFTLTRSDFGWLVDGEPVDSVSTDDYLNTLVNLSSRGFVDDDNIVVAPNPIFVLKIEGNNFSPIVIDAFEAGDEYSFLVTSSINPTARFSGIKDDLGKKVFKGKSLFKIKE